MARAPPFGPRASPRLRLRPCTSADSVAPQATVHLSRPGTILPPPHSVAAYAAPLGPCFLPLRLPPAPPAASHLRQCIAQCLPHIHGLGAFSQHSHCRSTHPSDRAGPRGSPSLGRPGVRASVTSPPTGSAPVAPQSRMAWTALPSSSHRQFGFRRPASHSAGSVTFLSRPLRPGRPTGQPQTRTAGRPDSGLRQLKSPHGEDMSLCSNSGRASAAPSRYHYDGRSSGVQPRRIAPGPGRNPPRVRASTSPSLARRLAFLLAPITKPLE